MHKLVLLLLNSRVRGVRGTAFPQSKHCPCHATLPLDGLTPVLRWAFSEGG
jgi:hypothetical protein